MAADITLFLADSHIQRVSEVDGLGSDNAYSEWEGLTHPQIKRRRSVADLTFMCPFTYYLV